MHTCVSKTQKMTRKILIGFTALLEFKDFNFHTHLSTSIVPESMLEKILNEITGNLSFTRIECLFLISIKLVEFKQKTVKMFMKKIDRGNSL